MSASGRDCLVREPRHRDIICHTQTLAPPAVSPLEPQAQRT
jgi:hypothetical protein